MLRSGQPELIRGVRLSLETLALHQADNGQIPKFVQAQDDADFWYVGCIDATLWWLIAYKQLCRQAPDLAFEAELAPAQNFVIEFRGGQWNVHP